jgi:hypothetical protein
MRLFYTLRIVLKTRVRRFPRSRAARLGRSEKILRWLAVTISADRSRSRIVLHILRSTTARMPPHLHRLLGNIKRDNRTC